jgi:hypothetical protein
VGASHSASQALFSQGRWLRLHWLPLLALLLLPAA